MIQWDGMIGRLTVDDETWGAIEWSEKRQAWCIEDVEGRCLRHASSIHGSAASKEAAVALAEALIRSGEFPSPEQVRQRRKEWRNQPSAIRRRAERDHELKLFSAMCAAEHRDRDDDGVTPFYELFADAYDLSDPNLWRSNSFALLRPRLIISVEAAITRYEYELFAAERRRKTSHRTDVRLSAAQKRLVRAQQILNLLKGAGDPS